MKKIKQSLLGLLVLLTFVSCKKDISSNNFNYIGTWNWSDGALSEQIIIHQDGTGAYTSVGLGFKKDISGYVKFDGDNFKVTAFGIKKGFITYTRPTKVVTSQVPLAYFYMANFNEKTFIRE